MNQMRLLSILVRYGVEHYAEAEQEAASIFARQFPGVEREVVIVDNALPADTVVREPGRTLIGGDNRVREFTGFDRAIRYVGEDLASYDSVHFATSAFNTLYTSYLERFNPAVLSVASGRLVCLGHIDCYNQPVQLRAFTSQHWVRSCFFFLPPAAVRALGSFVSETGASGLFSGDPANPFRADAPISARYQRYIIEWLTGADVGQGVTWHSRLQLTPEGLADFEQKTICILNEQLLGVRLRAMGCPLVDVTWLSTRTARAGTVGAFWHTPWRDQLAGRDRDAITIGAA
jgi:hypothetical protein